MYNYISKLGKWLIDLINNLGYAALMLVYAFFTKPSWISIHFFIKQIYNLAFRSALIIIISSFFIGAVLAIQGYAVLVQFKAETFLGTMVSIAVIRELAPVVAGLLYAGRAGSSLTAEVALMKSTEQLSSLEMMAVNPLTRVIAPRFWASILSLPMLCIVFMAVAVFGASVVGVDWKQIEPSDYWGSIRAFISYGDFIHGFVKSIIFAIFISWVSVYKGYTVIPNSEGVSKATTDSVVISSLGILFIDLLIAIYYFG